MNLIICTTPLQVLIAEKIIELHREENFIFKMIVLFDNGKNRKYYERLSRKVKESEYIFVNRDKYIIECINLKFKSFFHKKVKKVFLANIDEGHIHIQIYIYNFFKNQNIIIETFDDGTANISKSSFFYKKEDFSLKTILKYATKFLLLSPINMSDIKNRIHMHYSIYNGMSNIVENVTYIELFDCIKLKAKSSKVLGKVILIGQPIYELNSEIFSKQDYIELVSKIFKELNVDMYFPHPRENVNIKGINYIDSSYIVEDYLCETMNLKESYIIYNFFSGAIFPFLHLKNVKIISIQSDKLKLLDDHYNLMRKKRVEILYI